jgi:glycosyltransferase involved in cell wall biosynthesis
LPAVIFVLIQTEAAANGGIASISHVIGKLKRHRPIIVTDRDNERVGEWRSRGIEIHVIAQTASKGILRNPISTLRSYWRYRKELGALIRRSGARVVHANDPLALQLSIAPAKMAGAKLVFNLRGTFGVGTNPSPLKYRGHFAAADRVLYLSNDMGERWSRLVPNARRSCSVTYSVVDQQRFRPTPIQRDEQPVVLVSGLIRPLKGQLEFLRNVAPALASAGVKVWLAGDFDRDHENYVRQCEEAAAALGDCVTFLGYRSDLPELIARSRAVVVCSFHEGLVRAMIEAMSSARPVVSFDICSAREVLETEAPGAGTVVPLADYSAMAAAILRYCSDADAAEGAGALGRAAAERLFAADEVVERYEKAYDALESRS